MAVREFLEDPEKWKDKHGQRRSLFSWLKRMVGERIISAEGGHIQ